MTDLLQQGVTNAWFFVPTVILLGALHGLEPGHSKTLMAAFIVAIRGTAAQAVLLGVAATVSHTLIVWIIALGGMLYFRNLDAEAVEPYFQLASGVLIIAIAAWMAWRTWRDQHPAHRAYTHDHPHDHDHRHAHVHGHPHRAPDDLARVAASGRDTSALTLADPDDAHARAHAEDIRRRFAGARKVTTAHIVLFGLTGGLIPCPAAITVLLLCLQLQQVWLGALLVLCFSVGLAATLVAVGVIAAIGIGQALRRLPWLDVVARRAPYLSSALIVSVGIYVVVTGWIALTAPAT